MRLQEILPDGGVYYAETNLNYWIVEPWNALSSLSFLIPVVYWHFRIKGNYRAYPFFIFGFPFMILGGIGSTLFHAFRASPYLLLLDVLPMLILSIGVSLYFWVRLLPHWSFITLIIIPYFLLQYSLHGFIPRATVINISYILRGILIFLPMVLMLHKMKYRYWTSLVPAILWFILALGFRFFDKQAAWIMYMGSHWLWHISTAIGTFYLAEYLYFFQNDNLERSFDRI